MKLNFVNIAIAEITQKKLKSCISSAVPFEKLKRKTSVQVSAVKMIKKLWREV